MTAFRGGPRPVQGAERQNDLPSEIEAISLWRSTTPSGLEGVASPDVPPSESIQSIHLR